MAYIHELADESVEIYGHLEATRKDLEYVQAEYAQLPWWNLIERWSLSADMHKYKRRERIFFDRWMYLQKMISYGVSAGQPNPFLKSA